jgi:TetR/AcrR family transcriptional regulator
MSKQVTTERPVVRTRDPVRTRERILRNATTEFAAKGYDAGRVEAIARRSKVSKNMLYHYFRSKEGLFVAVLERMYERFRANQQDLAIRDGDPLTAMRQLVAHTFHALLDHPEVIALLNAENLQKGRHIQHSARIRDLYDPLVRTIADVLNRGEEAGIFRPNIDPVTLYLTLSSLAYHYISNQHTLKAAFGIDFTAPERQKAWLAHITEMVVGFCRTETVARRRPARVVQAVG